MLNTYRPDIDGLRAVAVTSVILCHAQIAGFAGGFVGVDIFFVISGFLISGIILREMAEGIFSFKNFYVRRVRRILPALLTVLLFSIILASFVLLPNDFRRFGKSVIASIGMIPNIAAWLISGDYFAATTDSNLLLHLWSLGVEEQFYFLFPLMLWLVVRNASQKAGWILLLLSCTLSLTWAGWAALHSPDFGFYWLPTRSWEFLFGIAVAAYQADHKPHKQTKPLGGLKYLVELFALLGGVLIVFSVLAPQSATLGSSLLYQILSCFGVVTLILTGIWRQTIVHKIVALKPIVGIGLISYSLYLWHWPLLSFLSYWQDGLKVEGKEFMVLGALILSVILAIVTWKYVEQPFRNKRRWQPRPLIGTVLLAQMVLLAVSVIIWRTQGLPQRFDARQFQYTKGQVDANPLQADCLQDGISSEGKAVFNENKCLMGADLKQLPRFVVWGDSHANAITPAFIALAKQYNITGIQASFSSAAPLLNLQVTSRSNQWNNRWHHFNEDVMQSLQKHPTVTDVFLTGRWNGYVMARTRYESNVYNGEAVTPSLSYQGERDSFKAFELSLKDTVMRLKAQGKRVWLIMPTPEIDRNVPRWLTGHETEGKDIWVEAYPERRALLLPTFKKAQAEYGLQLLDPTDILCRDNKRECRINAHGDSFYLDDNHLAPAGALFLSDMLRPAFKLMQNQQSI